MPYQVGWEFFNNRENKISNVQGGCDKLLKFINDSKSYFITRKRYPYHPKAKVKLCQLYRHK